MPKSVTYAPGQPVTYVPGLHPPQPSPRRRGEGAPRGADLHSSSIPAARGNRARLGFRLRVHDDGALRAVAARSAPGLGDVGVPMTRGTGVSPRGTDSHSPSIPVARGPSPAARVAAPSRTCRHHRNENRQRAALPVFVASNWRSQPVSRVLLRRTRKCAMAVIPLGAASPPCSSHLPAD